MKMVILRGLPGSGKSHYRAGKSYVSADSYFEEENHDGSTSYNFDAAKLGVAHASCFRDACEIVREGEDEELYIDNTNTSAVEMAPYVALAAAYGCEVEIILFDTPLEVCLERQTHGVPEKTMHHMVLALEGPLPPWWPQQKVIKWG